MHQKLAPDPFLILLNIPKQILHAGNSFENKKFWKMIIKKTLKSQLYFFFQTQSHVMDKVISNKRGLKLVTSCSSVYETNSVKSSLCYILSDQVWWCNVKQFLSYCKNWICKFMQVNSWHKLFNFHLSFWIWKVWKGREKISKDWISWEWKELFR